MNNIKVLETNKIELYVFNNFILIKIMVIEISNQMHTLKINFLPLRYIHIL